MKSINIISELIKQDGYIAVSKKLIQTIGLNEAVMYGELLSKFKYYIERNRLTKEGEFYCTCKTLQELTSLSKYQQTKAINKLVELGLIEKNIKGMPAKRYFRIVTENNNIYEILKINKIETETSSTQLLKNSLPSSKETQQQEVEKLYLSNNKDNNKDNKNNIIINNDAKASVKVVNKSLFSKEDNLKVLETKLSSLNKNKKRKETAILRFKIAKIKKNYKDVTFRDISYYFAKVEYPKVYGKDLLIQDNYYISDVKKVLDSYEIETEHSVIFLMQLVKVYMNKKANERFPDFTANVLKQHWILADIAKYAKLEM